MSLRLLEDLRNQAASLRSVLRHHTNEGRKALELAAAAIAQAPRVIVTGMGASLFAAMPLAYELTNCEIVAETSDLLHYRSKKCGNAVVVLVSRSGESVEAIKLLPLLKKIGTYVIGVTGEPGSTLARVSDLSLIVNSGKDEMVALQSYTGTMLLLLLVAALAKGELPADVRAEAEHAISKFERILAESETAAGYSLGEAVYLLGRGPSLASVQEGALLFHEVAKFPAIPMEAGNFRHGPLEVVDEKFCAVVFASQPTTRNLDRSLAKDLRTLKAHVELIEAEEVPLRFIPMVEIVPVQFAAMRLAQSRGIQPGALRHATLVTRSETGLPRRRPDIS